MNYTYFVSEDSITLVNVSNGNQVTIFKNDPRFDNFKELIMVCEYEAAENLDTKVAIQRFSKTYRTSSSFSVKIVDGNGVIELNGSEYPLANPIIDRMIKMESEGFQADPLVKFLENLYRNPSATAVDELYLFLEQTGLPITTDGCFIAYKIVKSDYMDIYSGKFDNSVGKVIEMPRFSVDDKRENTCSSGLHFCSKDYLAHYGSSKKETDRCVLVKINPADVVSIPSDYNNAKGRTCKYEVVGEMNDSDWRKILAERDYTDTSVVDEYGDEDDYIDGDDQFEYPEYEDPTIDDFFFNSATNRWHMKSNNNMVSRSTVVQATGWDLSDILRMEQK